MSVWDWIPLTILAALFATFFGMVLRNTIGRLLLAIRISKRVGQQPPPRMQAYMPHNYGWYYTEFEEGVTGLATLGFNLAHAACFDDARVLRHPNAPWWSWFMKPRSGLLG